MSKNNKKSQNKNKATTGASLAWTDIAWEDYLYWQDNDRAQLERINTLLEECKRHPFKGIGKPEPLLGNLTGFWSRRITQEHRLVYMVKGGTVYVIQCRYHYED